MTEKIEFEVWNKHHNRFATEDEIENHLHTNVIGSGFVDKIEITVSDPLIIKNINDLG